MFVPVRHNHCGTLTLCTGRLDNGDRVGLAFSCEKSLIRTLGPRQQWIELDLSALHEMLEPTGVMEVRVDPLPAVMVAAAA